MVTLLRPVARALGLGRVKRGLPDWWRQASRRLDVFPPRVRTIEYKGFTLYYSRGTSLVEALRREGSYEPNVVDAIVQELHRHEAPVFLDVGANIGLISLAVLASLPSARVYAWEPGLHQRALLERTILCNSLGQRLKLSGAALAAEEGTAQFATHGTRHASSDGFLDTGRGGRSRVVVVQTTTLDKWWHEHGQPEVNIVKIDTEGSELDILHGAQRMLAHTRPALVLEIHPLNLRAYGLSQDDMASELGQLEYRLETIFGEAVNPGNQDRIFARHFEFIARHV